MVAVSLMIEGQNGLTWSHWKQLVSEVEDLGFVGLFRSDHFTNAQPPDKPSLEMIVSLTYLADHTQHVHFGPLVAPFSMRNPMFLARQAAALDDLSSGRMILGVGAGWQEREHYLFGFELGDVATRMARFAEGLEVVTRLLHSDEPVSFEGRFYKLRGATLLPRPQRPGGPPVLIGGTGPKYTLPLVARYANIWNAVMIPPDKFRQRSVLLDTLLREAGRKPGDVKRTLMHRFQFGRDENELERRLSPYRAHSEFAGKSLNEVIDKLRVTGDVVGTPDSVIEQIQRYAAAGVEELMLQWLDIDDMDGLRAFARSVLPQVQKA